jgi:hypothetical protein
LRANAARADPSQSAGPAAPEGPIQVQQRNGDSKQNYDEKKNIGHGGHLDSSEALIRPAVQTICTFDGAAIMHPLIA